MTSPSSSPDNSPRQAADRVETVWFDSDTAAPGLARAQTRSVLVVHGVDAVTITQAELLVSELVTNVVRHTSSTRIGFAVAVSANAVRVDVHENFASSVPKHASRAIADVPVTSTGGRGIALVDWLSTEWGVTRRGQVTTTWFAIAVDEAGHGALSAPPDGDDAMSGPLRAALDRSRLLLRITEALGRATTAEQVADIVTHSVRDHVGAVFTGIALVEADGSTMRYLSLHPLPEATAQRWDVFPVDGNTPVTRAVVDGEPYFHPTVEVAEEAFPGLAAHMHTAGTQAIAHLPLISGGTTFGTFALAWEKPYEFDAETKMLLLIVAGYVAQALARR